MRLQRVNCIMLQCTNIVPYLHRKLRHPRCVILRLFQPLAT